MKYDHHRVEAGKVPAYMADTAFIVHLEQPLARNAKVIRAEQPSDGGRHRSKPRAVAGPALKEDAARGAWSWISGTCLPLSGADMRWANRWRSGMVIGIGARWSQQDVARGSTGLITGMSRTIIEHACKNPISEKIGRSVMFATTRRAGRCPVQGTAVDRTDRPPERSLR